MKKKFDIAVDCAACALKIEDAYRKIENVADISINFVTSKMIVTADKDNFEDVLQQIEEIGKKVDADFAIVL